MKITVQDIHPCIVNRFSDRDYLPARLEEYPGCYKRFG